ncbi:MAG: hypothetical protein K0R98_42 [Rickettsiaceae bacterium]|jgi:hypothetical protein|nr:hypothetical protein [Rickettsiaceae bacterium]
MAGPEQQGVNTAIASGAAFGGGPAGKGFSGVNSLIPVKGLAEAAIFKEHKLLQGLSSEHFKGMLGMLFDTALRPDSKLKVFFDMFHSKEQMFEIFDKNSAASNASNANASSGGSANAHSVVNDIALPMQQAGMKYAGEEMNVGLLPSPRTPGRGAARGAGMGIE